jgi:hypothetical protein
VLRDVVTALPGMFRDRRRAVTVVGRRSLMSWAVAK